MSSKDDNQGGKKSFITVDQNPLRGDTDNMQLANFTSIYFFKKRKLLTSPAQAATMSRDLSLSGNAIRAEAQRGESNIKMFPWLLMNPQIFLSENAWF